MKRFIFAYIAFACVFLLIYGIKSKYEGDQVGTLLMTIHKNEAPSSCTSAGRYFVYLYQRPDNSTYYLCKTRFEPPIPLTYTEHYISSTGRFIWSLIGAFVVGLLTFYFNPFIHYLNSVE